MDGGLVRAMTWNIWWRFGPRWTERQPGVVATIRRFDPDVLALQEVWGDQHTSQAEQIAEALGGHAAYAEPSYPALPDPPRNPDDEGVTRVGAAGIAHDHVGVFGAKIDDFSLTFVAPLRPHDYDRRHASSLFLADCDR